MCFSGRAYTFWSCSKNKKQEAIRILFLWFPNAAVAATVLLIAAGTRRASITTHCQILITRRSFSGWLTVRSPCDWGGQAATLTSAAYSTLTMTHNQIMSNLEYRISRTYDLKMKNHAPLHMPTYFVR